MSKLVLVGVGPNKVNTIKVVREITGMGLKEATDTVDNVEKGVPYIFENLSSADAQIASKKFDEIGAITQLDSSQADEDIFSEEDVNEQNLPSEGETVPSSEENESSTSEKYVPPVASGRVHQLDREGTLHVLKECEKIATGYEKVEADIASTVQGINAETQKGEALRNVISKEARMKRLAVTAIAFLVGMIGSILCIVTGVAAYIIMTMTVVKKDKELHKDENNANAEAYLRDHVDPLKEKLNILYAERDDYLNNGSRDWAISIVGKDLFYSVCIQDLYKLVEGHRADNLKEALIQYDDAQYKARMEEMQASIQNATEVAAAESVKQTEYNKRIEKNTRQAANASKATAAHTRSIDKNMRNNRR